MVRAGLYRQYSDCLADECHGVETSCPVARQDTTDATRTVRGFDHLDHPRRDSGRAPWVCPVLSTCILPGESVGDSESLAGRHVVSRWAFGGCGRLLSICSATSDTKNAAGRSDRAYGAAGIAAGAACEFYQRRAVGTPKRIALGRDFSGVSSAGLSRRAGWNVRAASVAAV